MFEPVKTAVVPPQVSPAAVPGVGATPPPAPSSTPEKKSLDDLRRELDELCDIACDAAMFSNKGSAVQWALSDPDKKFISKCRDVSGISKEWVAEKAIKRLMGRLNAPKVPAGDDQEIPPDLFPE